MEQRHDVDVIPLAGVHHCKLPVRDLERSEAWYARTLGYRRRIEFIEQGRLMGIQLSHPAGGPDIAIRLDPARAESAAGFDFFSIAVSDRATMDRLASHLDALGERHAGVHMASFGWILPRLLDPDGHEVRFYSLERHTELPEDGPAVVNDPRETAARREAELRRRAAQSPDQP